ncbi:MAG: filamentous hemagglutinin N-terminal domain-containing protein, partial [Sandaracinobacteroides sp.]
MRISGHQCRASRHFLLQSMSAIAIGVALSAVPAKSQALNVLRPGGGAPATTPTAAAGVAGASLTAGMVSAREASLRNAARVTAAVDFAKNAQQAARTASTPLALAGLAPVGNGLNAPNGLRPAAGITRETVGTAAATAALDASGVATWQGAGYPTEVPNGNAVTVTIKQNEPTAILSWETFNVGRETTLVFDQKLAGVAQPEWVAVNRIVGSLDPATGVLRSGLAPTPSQILGTIKADGIVVVLNQNGILFGPNSQVNARSVLATSFEVGAPFAGNLPVTVFEDGTAAS